MDITFFIIVIVICLFVLAIAGISALPYVIVVFAILFGIVIATINVKKGKENNNSKGKITFGALMEIPKTVLLASSMYTVTLEFAKEVDGANFFELLILVPTGILGSGIYLLICGVIVYMATLTTFRITDSNKHGICYMVPLLMYGVLILIKYM